MSMMMTTEVSSPSPSRSLSSSNEPTRTDLKNPSPKSTVLTPTPPPSSISRLWRPAAQRNVRNQWSNLASYRHKWVSLSSTARSQATSLVNAYLSQSYMNAMDLGVLSDMPNIRKKAGWKLFKQQELHQRKLLSSYKDMVSVVTQMVKARLSMRCFLKGKSGSPLVLFSGYSEDENDTGDGGGIPVFTFLSIISFEALAEELVQMFIAELKLKRLLVVELLCLSCEEVEMVNNLHWSDELYTGEFDDLSRCNLLSTDDCKPIFPDLKDRNANASTTNPNRQVDHDVLQVYLTAWLTEVNISKHRVDEIFAMIGEEIHVSIS